MAWLRIPSRHVKGLTQLRKLSDTAVEELTSIIGGAPLSFSGDDLLAFVIAQSKEDKLILEEIISLLLSLTSLRLRLDIDVPRLGEIVCEAMNEGTHTELHLPTKEQPSFLHRLTSLLGVESLLYPVKGPDVIAAHEHVFAYARIISDIRPIFGSDIKVPPPAAAIVHTLQLTCHETESVKDFYIAMDQNDLAVLCDVVNRAQQKADSLRSLLDKTGMAIVGEGEKP